MLSKSMLGLRRVAATKYIGLNVMRASFSTNAGEKFTEKMAKTGGNNIICSSDKMIDIHEQINGTICICYSRC